MVNTVTPRTRNHKTAAAVFLGGAIIDRIGAIPVGCRVGEVKTGATSGVEGKTLRGFGNEDAVLGPIVREMRAVFDKGGGAKIGLLMGMLLSLNIICVERPLFPFALR